MIKLIYLIGAVLLLVACVDPKSDAEKVCKALSQVDWSSDNKTKYEKYMSLQADMAVKYKGKPSQYLDFQKALDSCIVKTNRTAK